MKKFKRLIAFILTIALAVSGLSGIHINHVQAATELDTSKCVTFSQFSATHNIPNTVIFKGTHLIAIDAATDEIWTMAEESQHLSSQEETYYKSELTNGSWYNITDSNGISSINGDEGTPVPTSELADLYVQYYTFELGITRNAIDDGRHCIFDGDYPYYDLWHLQETSSMVQQYDVIVSRNNEKSRMDNFYRGILSDFLNKDLRNDYTDDCDTKLYALQDVYDALCAQDRKDDASIIYKLMAKLDNMRRAEIFRQLVEENEIQDAPPDPEGGILDGIIGDSTGEESTADARSYINLMDELLQKAQGTGYSDGDNEFIENSDVVTAITTDMDECQTSHGNRSSDILEPDGDRVIDGVIFTVASVIINGAGGGLNATMDDNIEKLGYLFNIESGDKIKPEEELAEIDNELIDPATEKFGQAIRQTESNEYLEAKARGVSDKGLSNILENQSIEIDIIRTSDLQEIIKAKTDRMEIEDAMVFTLERINSTFALHRVVPGSDFKSYANNEIDLHIAWLTELFKELYNKADSSGSLLEQLLAELEALTNKKQTALDANKLGEARQLQAAMNVVQDRIDKETANIRDVINDPNATAAEIAQKKAELGDENTMAGAVQGIVDDTIKNIYSGDTEGIETTVQTLGAIGDTDGLNQIKDAVDNQDGISDNIKNAVDEAIDAADGGDDESSAMSEDDLLAALASILGDIDSLNEKDLASAIRAFELLGRDGYDVAAKLAGKLVGKADSDGSIFVYKLLSESLDKEYASIRTIGLVAGYRHLKTGTKSESSVYSLTGAGAKNTKKVFKFKVGTSVIELADGTKTPELDGPIKAKGNGYVTAKTVLDYFNCTACDIKKSTYGLCIDSAMESKAQDLYKQLSDLLKES